MTVSESIVIAASPEAVFDYTQDYAERTRWDPAVRSAEYVDKGPPPVVKVSLAGGMRSVFRYKLFDRPKQTSLVMENADGSAGGGGSWKYEAADGGTKFTMTNTMIIRWRIVHWLYGWLFRWVMRRSARKALTNAKEAIERSCTPTRA